MNRRFAPWLLSAVLLTLVCDLSAILVHQTFRQGANDPQIQIAEDMASAFANNQFTDEIIKSSFQEFMPTKTQVNIATSLSPWIQIYTEGGEVMESSAVVTEAQTTPKIPKGIFETVQKKGEDRITWQPKKGIRQAIVVTKFSGLKNGYIVAGRSLFEVEKRLVNMNWIIAIAWAVMMMVIGCAAAWNFGYFSGFKRQQKTPRL